MTPRNESRIFLVGPMGAGKTTIGNQLARSLNLDFIDLDQELERRTGASVSLIFDIEGESGFREREKKLIDELTQRDRTVLATGGGAVLAADNRQRLSRRGFVVYLKTPLETLVERTRYDTSRPLLHSGDPAATLGEILQVREPLYAEVADLVVDSGKLSVKQVLKMISEELQ
ncbi:MAG: shikimate kinase AroK [Gammaproteobacteria bacterium]|nr:shikimate kinase AroK [Gammaproteobacteria bacterium]